jgi:voltage-gated potassium channel
MDRPTRYQVVPQFVPFTDIKVKANLSEEEILEAVAHGSGFRVINTASTIPAKDNPTDRMAVEHFIVNRPYGCCIDRKSKVTIISTSSHDNPLVGNFAYYLAKLGGFNYVSREFGDVLQGSYYIPKVDGIPGFDEFMDDINALTNREDAWTVTILAASGAQEPEYPEEVHIGYGAPKGQPALDAPGLTIHDAAKAEQAFSALEGILSTDFGIKAERQMRHSSNAPYLYLRNLKNADKVNSFILRIAWSAMAWNPDRIRIAQSMADTLHGLLDLDNPREELSCLMIKDVGYANYGDSI